MKLSNRMNLRRRPLIPILGGGGTNVISTNFSDQTIGFGLAGWTPYGDTIDDIVQIIDGAPFSAPLSNRVIAPAHGQGSNTSGLWITLDEAVADGDLADTEILALVYFDDDGASSYVVGRYNGQTFGSDSYYWAESDPGGNFIELNSRVNGTWVTDLDQKTKTINRDTWYWKRFSLVGFEIKGKIWEHGTEEPATWDFEYTAPDDANFIASGKPGLRFFRSSSPAASKIYYNYFAVSPGDTIPVP